MVFLLIIIFNTNEIYDIYKYFMKSGMIQNEIVLKFIFKNVHWTIYSVLAQ